MTLTVSRDDLRDYLTCPKKLALKAMGIRAKETRRQKQVPAYAIGLAGEKLTEQVLEIIASLQAKESEEEVEVLRKKEKEEEIEIEEIVKSIPSKVTKEEFKKIEDKAERLVEVAVKDAFKYAKEPDVSYRDRVCSEMKKDFFQILGNLHKVLPPIKSVYKPTLKNRDVCSFGYPDFQLDTDEGHMLIEVKNVADLKRAIEEGRFNLLYYNSLLVDEILGTSVFQCESLPKPIKSILVVPRHGHIEIVSGIYPNFREIASEIWKIKRAAMVEGKLPDVSPEKSICKRCKFKKFCKEGESLDESKPIPLVYTVAFEEVKDKIEETKRKIRVPPGFYEACLKLLKEARKGSIEAKKKLELMDAYRLQLIHKHSEESCRLVYKEMPNEFDAWGGIEFLKDNYAKISAISNQLFPPHERRRKEIIRVAKRRWKIS